MPVDVDSAEPLDRPVPASQRIASAPFAPGRDGAAACRRELRRLHARQNRPECHHLGPAGRRTGRGNVSGHPDDLSCGVELSATATGTDTATWLDGMVRWYAGVDRSEPLDSPARATADIRLTWGNHDIGAGQTQTSHWQVQAAVPFHAGIRIPLSARHSNVKTATAVVRLRPEGRARHASPHPSTRQRTRHAPASLQPSDTLTVNYTVSSPVGIWQSTVELSGPCTSQDKFPEQLKTKLYPVAHPAIPANCPLGVPITVTVSATDARPSEQLQAVRDADPMIDVTPPTLSTYSVRRDGTPMSLPPVYFDGDSIGGARERVGQPRDFAVVWVRRRRASALEDSFASLAPRRVDQNVDIHVPTRGVRVPSSFACSRGTRWARQRYADGPPRRQSSTRRWTSQPRSATVNGPTATRSPIPAGSSPISASRTTIAFRCCRCRR